MEATQKAGAQISTKAFVQSGLILFILMLLAGVPLFFRRLAAHPHFPGHLRGPWAVLGIFLVTYARNIERNPQAPAVHAQDQAERRKYGSPGVGELAASRGYLGQAS